MKKLLVIIFLFTLINVVNADFGPNIYDVPPKVVFESTTNIEIETFSSNYFPAKVIQVIDGDTIVVSHLVNRRVLYMSNIIGKEYYDLIQVKRSYPGIICITNYRTIEVELWLSDTPEITNYYPQPFGKEATAFTKKSVLNKSVLVKRMGKSDKIFKAEVYYRDRLSDKRCLNKELIKNGFAWIALSSCKEINSEEWRFYGYYESDAKNQKIGLWSQQNPIPPWVWRKRKK